MSTPENIDKLHGCTCVCTHQRDDVLLQHRRHSGGTRCCCVQVCPCIYQYGSCALLLQALELGLSLQRFHCASVGLVGPEWWKSRTTCLELKVLQLIPGHSTIDLFDFQTSTKTLYALKSDSGMLVWPLMLGAASEWAPSTSLSQILSQILEWRQEQLIISRLICWTFQQDALIPSY